MGKKIEYEEGKVLVERKGLNPCQDDRVEEKRGKESNSHTTRG